MKNSLDDSSLDYVPQQVVGYFLLNKKSFVRDYDDELRVNMKQVVSSERWKVIGIYFYLSLPVLIFFPGWMRTYYGIPAAGIVVWMLYRSSRCERKLWQPGWNIDTIRSMCLIALIIALWVYFSGIGGMVYQNPDHIMRNGVFRILVNHKWPVVHTINTVRGTVNIGIVYYIGFWLPAALVGKVFGLTVGYLFQMVWAFIGIAIFYYLICEQFQKLSVWPLLGFMFFSGLDIIGKVLDDQSLWHIIKGFQHLEWWGPFQYTSFMAQLFWVFNQAIYAWVIFMMIMRQNENSHLIFLWSFGLLTCTIPSIGMIPYLLYKSIINKKGRGWLHSLLTKENILGGGTVGIVCGLYLLSNGSFGYTSEAFDELSKGHLKAYMMYYIVFIILEVGLYFLSIYHYQKNNPVYVLTLMILLICPLIHVGHSADFCMRASIPALITLWYLVYKTWEKARKQRDRLTVIFISALFIVGVWTPCFEIGRTITQTNSAAQANEMIMQRTASDEEVFDPYNNAAGMIDDSMFFKYLAR